MDFIQIFKDVTVSPLMFVTKVTNVKLKPATNTMQVNFTVPYEFSEADKNELKQAIIDAYGVSDVEAVYTVVKPESAPKKKEKETKKKNTEVPDDGVTIKGKPIKKDNYEKIVNIDQYSGPCLVKGRVIAVGEPRVTKTGKTIFKFDLTDKSSSITCKCFLEENEADRVMGAVKGGMYVAVEGRATYDTFDNEVVIMINNIAKSEAPKYSDPYPDKRVELHLHTKMSMMDSVLEIDKAVERAAQWGQKAIAVTDHGVVQSYPDALDAGKKYGVKIIYGVECYLIDDSSKCVLGSSDMPFEGSFVAFDIETTGLSPLTSSIIEIGAVKIVDGQITDSFNELIDPGFSLGMQTTELTGITTDMVKGKPDISVVLPKFLEFVGDLPVVAHNAKFDYNFIKKLASRITLNLIIPALIRWNYLNICLQKSRNTSLIVWQSFLKLIWEVITGHVMMLIPVHGYL